MLCRTNSTFNPDVDSWGDENEYYNDRPGAKPPSPSIPDMFNSSNGVNGVSKQRLCTQFQGK